MAFSLSSEWWCHWGGSNPSGHHVILSFNNSMLVVLFSLVVWCTRCICESKEKLGTAPHLKLGSLYHSSIWFVMWDHQLLCCPHLPQVFWIGFWAIYFFEYEHGSFISGWPCCLSLLHHQVDFINFLKQVFFRWCFTWYWPIKRGFPY